MKHLIRSFFPIACILVMASCGDDEMPPPGLQIEMSNDHVLVLNEGNFGTGNSSITAFDKSDQSTIGSLFADVNEVPLGDVVQSATSDDDRIYIVVNNSGKIEAVDKDDFGSELTISGLNSPRYMAFDGNNSALVTDLDSLIRVVNLEDGSITEEITSGDWTEFIVERDNDHLVTYPNRKELGVIRNRSMDSQIELPGFAVAMVETDDETTWVLCQVTQWDNSDMILVRIDEGSTSIDADYQFAGGAGFGLRMKAMEDELFLLVGDLFHFDPASDSAPQVFVEAAERNLYGLGVDEARQEIYLSDAIDYSQAGIIYRYGADGTSIDSFGGGIIPAEFYFYE